MLPDIPIPAPPRKDAADGLAHDARNQSQLVCPSGIAGHRLWKRDHDASNAIEARVKKCKASLRGSRLQPPFCSAPALMASCVGLYLLIHLNWPFRDPRCFLSLMNDDAGHTIAAQLPPLMTHRERTNVRMEKSTA